MNMRYYVFYNLQRNHMSSDAAQTVAEEHELNLEKD